MRSLTFNIALILDRLSRLAPPCLYGLGAALVLAKVFPVPEAVTPGRLALAAGGVLLAAAVVAAATTRAWYTPEYALAWLDLRNHAGGAIMAGTASPDRAGVRPGVSLVPLLRRLGLPIVFVLAAYLVPVPEVSDSTSGASLEQAIARMERRIDEAADREIVAKPDAVELRRQIGQIENMAEVNPEAAAEALASMPAKLDDAVGRRLDSHAQALEQAVAALRELENAGADAGDMNDSGEWAKKAGEMAEALQEMASAGGGMENLPPDLQQALRETLAKAGAGTLRELAANPSASAALDAKTVEKLLEALEKSGGDMCRACSTGTGAGNRAEAALDRLQSVTEALERMRLGEAVMAGAMPGSGAVNRGEGDAPLVFSDKAERGGLDVTYQPLPEGELALPDLRLERERRALPEDQPPEEFQAVRRSGAVVEGPVSAGGSGTTLGPERARAAERYFERLGAANP